MDPTPFEQRLPDLQAAVRDELNAVIAKGPKDKIRSLYLAICLDALDAGPQFLKLLRRPEIPVVGRPFRHLATHREVRVGRC